MNSPKHTGPFGQPRHPLMGPAAGFGPQEDQTPRPELTGIPKGALRKESGARAGTMPGVVVAGQVMVMLAKHAPDMGLELEDYRARFNPKVLEAQERTDLEELRARFSDANREDRAETGAEIMARQRLAALEFRAKGKRKPQPHEELEIRGLEIIAEFQRRARAWVAQAVRLQADAQAEAGRRGGPPNGREAP